MEIQKVEISDSFYPVHISLKMPDGNAIDYTVLNVAIWFQTGGIEKEQTMISVLHSTIRQPIANRFVEPEISALVTAIMKNLLNPLGSWAGEKINVWIGNNHIVQLCENRKVRGIYEIVFHPYNISISD